MIERHKRQSRGFGNGEGKGDPEEQPGAVDKCVESQLMLTEKVGLLLVEGAVALL